MKNIMNGLSETSFTNGFSLIICDDINKGCRHIVHIDLIFNQRIIVSTSGNYWKINRNLSIGLQSMEKVYLRSRL